MDLYYRFTPLMNILIKNGKMEMEHPYHLASTLREKEIEGLLKENYVTSFRFILDEDEKSISSFVRFLEKHTVSNLNIDGEFIKYIPKEYPLVSLCCFGYEVDMDDVPQSVEMVWCHCWKGDITKLSNLHTLSFNLVYEDQMFPDVENLFLRCSETIMEKFKGFSSTKLKSLVFYDVVNDDIDLDLFPNLEELRIYFMPEPDIKILRTFSLKKLESNFVPSFPVEELVLLNGEFDLKFIFENVPGLRKLKIGDQEYGKDSSLLDLL